MKKCMKIMSIIAILACIAVVFVACAPKDGQAAKEKLEKAGYTVQINETPTRRGIYCDCELGAEKDGESVLYAVLYVGTDSAKNAYSNIASEFKDEGWKVEQKGKWVIAGTEEAIKAFTK
ncbi:MAG: hypothetical protein ACI4SK_03220 [Christensenellales bacterium]